MKNRFCTLFLAILALLLSGKTNAQETFAPLLTEETIAFVHADFSKVNVDSLKAEITTWSETLMKTLGFDARSTRATLRDLEIELEVLDAMVRPAWETITQEFGIQEAALIVDTNLIENWIPAVLAFSWKGKTEQDCQKLISNLLDILYPIAEKLGVPGLNSRLVIEENLQEIFFPVGDFLFILLTNDIMHDPGVPRLIMTDRVKAAADSKDSPVLQAIGSLNRSDEIKAVLGVSALLNYPPIREDLEPELLELQRDELPIEFRNFLLSSLKIEWAAVSFPISEMLVDSVEDDRRLITVKLPSVADAQELRGLMNDFLEALVSRFQEEMQEEAGVALPPLFFEFYKGYSRTLFPDVEGDRLIFRMKHWRQYTRFSLLPF